MTQIQILIALCLFQFTPMLIGFAILHFDNKKRMKDEIND